MKKNKILVLVAFSLLSIVNVNASCKDYYSQSELDYIITNSDPIDLDLSCAEGSIFVQEYLDRVESSLNEMKNKEQHISPFYYADPVLDITPIQQEKSNYCGLANVKMVLQYLNGTSLSQSVYAIEMETYSKGTDVWRVTNELNKYSSKKYQYANNLSQDTFKSIIDSNIANNKPLILHSQTEKLALYNGHKTGHYLTVRGHTLRHPAITVDYVHYVDSNNQDYGKGSTFGNHYDNFNNVYNSISGGRFTIY